MATLKIADVVVAIPYGDGSRKRYQTVGSLLRFDNNDESKGPGFVVMLDSTFNPAGAPSRDGSVALSCYHPKAKPAVAAEPTRTHPPLPRGSYHDDDIPF